MILTPNKSQHSVSIILFNYCFVLLALPSLSINTSLNPFRFTSSFLDIFSCTYPAKVA